MFGSTSWLRNYCSTDLNLDEMLLNKKVPEDFIYEARKQGLFGMRIPKEYGGLFLTLVDTLKVIEQLSSIDISLATYLVVQHTFSFPILKFANQLFRSYYMPQIVTGKVVGCFALSEPGLDRIQEKSVQE